MDINGISYLSSFFDAQLQAYCPMCWNSTVVPSPGKGAFFWNFKIETGASCYFCNGCRTVSLPWSFSPPLCISLPLSLSLSLSLSISEEGFSL